MRPRACACSEGGFGELPGRVRAAGLAGVAVDRPTAPWQPVFVRWASALSESSHTEAAVSEAAGAVRERLGGAPDVLFVFVSADHARGYESIPRRAGELFPDARVIGCSSGGIIGDGREVEQGTALSMTGAVLPEVQLRTLRFDALPAPDDAHGWRRLVGLEPGPGLQLILLADPFTCNTEALLRGLDGAYPEAAKTGGLASGGRRPGMNVLLGDGEMYRDGAVGLVLRGHIAVDTVVAQGCRPIGEPMIVTRCNGHILEELDRGNPVEVLQNLYRALDEHDRHLFEDSLFIGIEMQDKPGGIYRHGDFLVRNLIGLDPDEGAIAVDAHLEPYQVVQVHLRDGSTSAEDLARRLDDYCAHRPRAPSGGLLFSCLGRGEHMYGEPGHDSAAFHARVGPVPLGGFFCNGEIGPVGGRTFVHGYTSSFALFREP